MRCPTCDVLWQNTDACWVCGKEGREGWSYVANSAPDFDYDADHLEMMSWAGLV